MRERLPFYLVTTAFVLLAAGIFYTQIIRYGHYAGLSKNNAVRVIPIDGPRGMIFDRNGETLVSNRLSFDVAIVYNELRNRAKLAAALGDVLGMQKKEIIRALERAGQTPYTPVTVRDDVEKTKALRLEELAFDIPGLIIRTSSRRDYLCRQAGSHIFGYLSPLTESEYDGLKECGYRANDLIGRDGLEQYYESFLKGVDGGTQIEVDARGRQTRLLGIKEPAAGTDLYLTIDRRLQLAADTLLGGRRGAVVALDPVTGEILALASHPSYDPNIFVMPRTSAERLRLMRDRAGRPLSNKVVSGLYPPGSVFKVVTASAGLETRKISPDIWFSCGGSYTLGSARFGCWKEGGHGSQNITQALMNSCNVYFYNVGRIIGPDPIESYAKSFGFGRKTGVDLPDEVAGMAPGRAWKQMARREKWYDGETLHYAIGQGYLQVTPLQVATMMAVMANGGRLVRPFVVRKAGNETIEHQAPKETGLRASTVGIVREGLWRAVNGESGTGRRAAIDGVKVAGKTGTAQNPHGASHAWFAGFAPYDHPRICLAVIIEQGGHGGVRAAEVAHGIFQAAKEAGYF